MSDPAVRRVGREGHILFIGPAQPYETIRQQIDLYHRTLQENGHTVPNEMVVVREFFALGAAKRPWTGPAEDLNASTRSTPPTGYKAKTRN